MSQGEQGRIIKSMEEKKAKKDSSPWILSDSESSRSEGVKKELETERPLLQKQISTMRKQIIQAKNSVKRMSYTSQMMRNLMLDLLDLALMDKN